MTDCAVCEGAGGWDQKGVPFIRPADDRFGWIRCPMCQPYTPSQSEDGQFRCDGCHRPVSMDDGIVGIVPPNADAPVVVLGSLHAPCLSEWFLAVEGDSIYHGC